MSAIVCPYCRGPIEAGEPALECEGCGTPHHADCYEENDGCTVFGCVKAPPDEAKVSVSSGEVVTVSAGAAAGSAPAAVAPPPPPVTAAAPPPPTSLPELQRIAYNVVPSMFALYPGSISESGPTGAPEYLYEPAQQPKTRMAFVLLGALLGAFGAHNWYAGYRKKAASQLAITVLTLGLASPMSWTWAIIDICTISQDANGVQFTS